MSVFWQGIYERSPVVLQHLYISLYGLQTLRQRMDRRFRRRLLWLKETETWSPEHIREWQTFRLRRVLDEAYRHIPFYQHRMREARFHPEDIRTAEHLRHLPILRREDVRSARHRMVSSRRRRNRLVPGHTSGTTGSPLEFWWDRDVCLWNNVMLHRARAWAGYQFRDRTATLLGNVIVPNDQQQPPFWRYCLPWNKVFFSSFHLERRHFPAYAEKLGSMDRPWLEAYPSTAYVLARFLEDRRATLPLRGVFLSSETLTANVRALIEERFDCPVWDAYSMAERVVFAAECEEHSGQHLFPEFGVVEILDEDDQPVPAGRPGRIVATGLWNLAMPFIRYDTGDVGGIDPNPCPCGRTLPKMLPVTTKAEDIVVTPDGRFVSSSVLTHPFKPLEAIEQSQIVQDSPEHLTVRIVRRPSWHEKHAETLLGGLRERLGDRIRIDLQYVDAIPRTRSGKYRWVVSRVPLRMGGSESPNLFSEDPASDPSTGKR